MIDRSSCDWLIVPGTVVVGRRRRLLRFQTDTIANGPNRYIKVMKVIRLTTNDGLVVSVVV